MAIPTWTVPLPQHDLVFRIENYASPPASVSIEFAVREGRLEAVALPVSRSGNPAVAVPYVPRWTLMLFDHHTMQVREVPVDVPGSVPEGEVRTIPIAQLNERRVVAAGSTAPDGYNLVSLNTGGSRGGIVGEIFGMNRRYRRGIAMEKDGRTIEVELPSPHAESYATITPIGWLDDRR
jgi:hypothetical protein